MLDEKEIIETLENLAVDKYIDERKLEEKDVEAIINIIVLYRQEKEKNKKIENKLDEINKTMLSDEEKEAFNYYKECNEKDLENYEYLGDVSKKQAKYLDVLLNLIEKQSKEIEELKETYNKLAKECNEENRRCMLLAVENQDLKDKIKAKIEEVEQWELYNMKIPKLSTLDERLGAKIGIKYVLQSLLDKE